LEWKVLYVGKAEDMSSDIVLDEILVGPVPVGVNKFILQADAPLPSQLPDGDLVGVTVVLVTCSYREREFVRVGYYVNNEYEGEAYDVEKGPVGHIDLSKVTRQILADKPRVTKFPIPWGDSHVVVSQNNAQVSVSGSPSSSVMHAEPQDEDEDAMQRPSIHHAEQPQDDMLPATVSSE
jgi:histone chaperone ASF1